MFSAKHYQPLEVKVDVFPSKFTATTKVQLFDPVKLAEATASAMDIMMKNESVIMGGGIARTILTNLVGLDYVEADFTGFEMAYKKQANLLSAHRSIPAKAEAALHVQSRHETLPLRTVLRNHLTSFQTMTFLDIELANPNSPLSVALGPHDGPQVARLVADAIQEQEQTAIQEGVAAGRNYQCKFCQMWDHQADCRNSKLVPECDPGNNARYFLHKQLPLREQYSRHSWTASESECAGIPKFYNPRYFYCDASVPDFGCALQTMQLKMFHEEEDTAFATIDGGQVVSCSRVRGENGASQTVAEFGRWKSMVNRTDQFDSPCSATQTDDDEEDPSTVPRGVPSGLNVEHQDPPHVAKALFPTTAGQMVANAVAWIDGVDENEDTMCVEVFTEHHQMFQDGLASLDTELNEFQHDLAQLEQLVRPKE